MITTRVRHRPVRSAVVAACVVLATGSGAFRVAAAEPAVPPGPAAAPVAATPAVERFTGPVEAFYVVPDPLPPGAPGELIRVQEVSSSATTRTVRIMYHSRDAQDRDRAVTGMLTHPVGPAPDGGWPVLSVANGTVGLAEQCARSRAGGPVGTLGDRVVGVASDYIGLGPVGEIHPYLSRLSEGHSVIDAVRAARNLAGSGAGPRWLAIGGSQGGHGAMSANELGEAHAPELELLGTVAMAPAAMFDRTYGGVDLLVSRVVGAMGLYGAATEYPGIDPADYVTPAGAEAAAAMRTGCLFEITSAVLGVPFDGFYAHDPVHTEPARSVIRNNDVGRFAVTSPLFLVQGTADTTVVPARTRDLFARLCAAGQRTDFLEVEGADHGNVQAMASAEITAWLTARLAGEPAATSCPASEPPVVVPGTATVPEGHTGTTTVRVPVTLSSPSSVAVTVRWGTGVAPGPAGQATPAVDYEPAGGTVTFAPGETAASVAVVVRGDADVEPDELVLVSFGTPTNARMGGVWGLGAATVLDDD